MVLLPAVTLPPMQLLLPSLITPGPCRRRHSSHSGLGEHLPGPALPLLMVLPPAVVLTAAPAAVLAADIYVFVFRFFVRFFLSFFFHMHKIKTLRHHYLILMKFITNLVLKGVFLP